MSWYPLTGQTTLADLGFGHRLRILRDMHKNRLIFFLMATSLLAGCGQYGDLYLPDETAAQQQVQEETEQQEEAEVTQPEDL